MFYWLFRAPKSSRFQNTPDTTIKRTPEILSDKRSQVIDVTPPGVCLRGGSYLGKLNIWKTKEYKKIEKPKNK